MPTSLQELGLTPGIIRLLVNAGLDSVEAVMSAEERLIRLPGITRKRVAVIAEALRLQKIHMADAGRRAFIADRAAQAERLQRICAFLQGIQSGSQTCGLTEALAIAQKAKRYADIMAEPRNPEDVGLWLRHEAPGLTR